MSHLQTGGVDWHYREYGDSKGLPVLLLHGFTGSAEGWLEFAGFLPGKFRVIAPDLPGHGKTLFPESGILPLNALADAIVNFTFKIADQPFILLGYSLGGRVALHIALRHSEKIRALIMIGASPGIADDAERRSRWEMDCALAREIRVKGVNWFADYWEHQPIFATQRALPEAVQKRIRKQRKANTREGLALALENWGPGKQEYLLPKLNQLSLPQLLIAGALDKKYCALNKEIARAASSSSTVVSEIDGAGHAAQLEKPEAVASAVNEFLRNLQE